MEMNMKLLFLFFLFVASSLVLKAARKKKLRPPGPCRLPIVGNLHLLDPNKPHRSLLALSDKHGPLMLLQLGSITTLVVSTKNIAEEIFRHHDIAFSGRPLMAAAKKLMYNNSSVAFAPYGEHWRQARMISMLELLSRRRVQAFEPVRMEEVAKLIAAVKALSGTAANLSELTLSLANNVVCRVAVGEEYGGGGYAGEGGVRLHDVLSETQRLLGGFWVADYFPAMGWVDRWVLRLQARLEKNFQEFDRFCDEVIRRHLNTKSGDQGGDYLHSLLRLHSVAAASSDHGGLFSTIDHVKAILAEVFIAGTDTASATITWTMTELIRNPRVMAKLQQELQHAATSDHINNKNSGELMNIIHEKELEKFKYLEQVIKESLRLHPPAPLLVPRETVEPCVIRGYEIPAKTRVIINATAISTDPNVWEKPLEFWPERFDGNGVDFYGQNFEYLPFGAGRRKCPGISFAMVIVQLVVANLVHCFEWSPPDGMKADDINMEEAIGITMHKKVPLRLLANYKY